MKAVLLISICCIAGVWFHPHSESIDSFYDKYKPLEKVDKQTQLYWVKKLTNGIYDRDEMKKLLDQPSKLKIVILGEEQIEQKDIDALKLGLKKDDLDKLISVREENEQFDFYLKSIDKEKTHLVYLVEEDGDFIFMSLLDEWSLKDLLQSKRL